MARLVAETVALVERYGAPVHLVGHDWRRECLGDACGPPRPDAHVTTVSVQHPAAVAKSLGDQQPATAFVVRAGHPTARCRRGAGPRGPSGLSSLLRGAGLSDAEVAVSAGRGLTRDQVKSPDELRFLAGVSHWVPTQASEALTATMLARIDATPDRSGGSSR
ncbi:MAG: hypothetical protein QOH37_239 [Nocardioidaceae bacterium]|nr:hypothetical protein [Nocardioidaceae bacterium]